MAFTPLRVRSIEAVAFFTLAVQFSISCAHLIPLIHIRLRPKQIIIPDHVVENSECGNSSPRARPEHATIVSMEMAVIGHVEKYFIKKIFSNCLSKQILSKNFNYFFFLFNLPFFLMAVFGHHKTPRVQISFWENYGRPVVAINIE